MMKRLIRQFDDLKVSIILRPGSLVVTASRSDGLEINTSVALDDNLKSLLDILGILSVLGYNNTKSWITDVALENGLVLPPKGE
jgi:hypothetical protein